MEKVKITIDIPIQLNNELIERKRETRVPKNEQIVNALKFYFDKNEKEVKLK